MLNNYIVLRHQFDCSHNGVVCAWDDFDYSNPKTNLVKYLEPGTKATIIRRKFPGVLVELNDGSQYWICKWDVHKE